MPDITIDPDELVALTLALCNIESPAGQEAEVGAFVFDWLSREGFAPRKIGMLPDRFDVLGVLPGRGDGHSLIFMVRCSEVYARLAMDVCGREKPAPKPPQKGAVRSMA